MSESGSAFCSKTNFFVFLAVLVLGLGIGGATTQFTVVNAIVLRGFSFPHPEQLVSVGLIDPKASDQNNNFGVGNIPTAQDYEDLKAAPALILAHGRLPQWIDNQRDLHKTIHSVTPAVTSPRIFQNRWRVAVIGRDFTAEDNRPGAEKVAILGDEIWRRDFGADPNIVGQSVQD